MNKIGLGKNATQIERFGKRIYCVSKSIRICIQFAIKRSEWIRKAKYSAIIIMPRPTLSLEIASMHLHSTAGETIALTRCYFRKFANDASRSEFHIHFVHKLHTLRLGPLFTSYYEKLFGNDGMLNRFEFHFVMHYILFRCFSTAYSKCEVALAEVWQSV